MIGLENFFPSLVEPSHPLNVIDSKGNLTEDDSATQSQLIELAKELLKDNFEMESFEEILINTAMQESEGNVSKAARLLGISRPTMAYKLKKLDGES